MEVRIKKDFEEIFEEHIINGDVKTSPQPFPRYRLCTLRL